MIKKIHRTKYHPALVSTQRLMKRFALWLCDTQVQAADVTLAKLQLAIPDPVEASWLWQFLGREVAKITLLQRAQSTADCSHAEKNALAQWISSVTSISSHFLGNPVAPVLVQAPNGWNTDSGSWKMFKVLFESFYEVALRSGLPYREDGTPTDVKADQVTYKKFVDEFCSIHKLDSDPDAREVCVLCGDELRGLEVDHWVNKGNIPLLSVCADNLVPICGECNAAEDTKNQKPVHTNGLFSDWFHPYLRPAHDTLQLRYQLPKMTVRGVTVKPADQPKMDNLDKLLNLNKRWTIQFKAEHRKKHKEMLDAQSRGVAPTSVSELRESLLGDRRKLIPSEPNYEVHWVLASAMLDPARLAAWRTEFGLAP